MRTSIVPAFFLLLLVSASFVVEAQRSRNKTSQYTRDRFGFNNTKVSRSKAKIVCPIFENTGYPYHGIGIKLGDPFAATYKFYLNKKWAMAIDFGKSASGLYNRYYRELFADYTNEDTIQNGQSIEYLTHKVKSDLVGEVKLLRHFDASKVSAGLQFYVGVGVEFRSLGIEYQFFESDENVSNQNQLGKITRSRYTHGIQGTIGIEYSYFSLPISAFMELDMYTDVLRDPGWRKVQGGVGLRYVF
jgi:hypothetical protein